MRSFALAVAGCSLLVFSGCLAAPRYAQKAALEQKRTFVPQVEAPKPLAEKPLFAAVKCRSFRALPPFDDRSFIIRRAKGELAEDYYNLWLASPQDLIGAAAGRYLEGTGLFKAVYDSGSGTQTAIGLEGVVTELLLDYTKADAPVAVVGLRLSVLDERTPDFAVLFTVEKRCEAPVAEKGPAAASQAFSAALGQALDGIAQAFKGARLPQ